MKEDKDRTDIEEDIIAESRDDSRGSEDAFMMNGKRETLILLLMSLFQMRGIGLLISLMMILKLMRENNLLNSLGMVD